MKNNNLYIQIRNKKIGILLIDARRSRNFSLDEVGNKTGISIERLEDFENGKISPSLPELEILAYTYNIPFEHFWGKKVFQSDEDINTTEKFQILLKLRNKIIGTGIQSKRQSENISVEELADLCEISNEMLNKYESGELEIPVPTLEIIAKNLNARIEDFFDNQGKIGAWRTQNAEMKSLTDLPKEFRDFITKPINEPYLDLAMKLSQLDVKKLRLVAEGLLEITL